MLTSAVRSIANSKFIANQSKKIGEDTAGYAAKFAIASICMKDGLGCYYYVTQSLKNERIPEEKRKFVAALDLSNGILMIATQLLLGATISSKKCQDKIKNKLFGNILKEENIKLAHEKLIKIKKFKGMPLEAFNRTMGGVSKYCTAGLSVITSLVAATVIAKRMIVPFIATPLASWYKEKYMDKNCNQPPRLIGQNCFDVYVARRNIKG
ncbi:MAG: hypothetical protein A2Y25_11595 [Candidatus Melainabacteria bacterium GWF2_37_15]|nr:MAG: hypothetical protein A2Y25_11595 [Candidatus Melainabacteria bacterium GWF2_37_15]